MIALILIVVFVVVVPRLALPLVILAGVVGVLWMGAHLIGQALGHDGETIVSFVIGAVWVLGIVAYPLICVMYLGLVVGPPILRAIIEWKQGEAAIKEAAQQSNGPWS
jgi:hypothetical protein